MKYDINHMLKLGLKFYMKRKTDVEQINKLVSYEKFSAKQLPCNQRLNFV